MNLALLARVLSPFALGYMMSWALRAVNAVAAPDLTRDFALDATQLGLLTSAYLLAFALAQFPLGVFLDRHGPRRVQSVLLSISALGCVIFALAPNFAALVAGRAIIGLGFGAGLMASFLAIVLWTEPATRPLLNGAVMSFGGLGIVAATSPSEALIHLVGWRNLFLLFAAMTAAAAAAIFLFVPEKREAPSGAAFLEQFVELLAVLKSRPFLRVAPLLGLAAGVQIATQTLWAGPWFRDVLGLGREEAAYRLMWMALSFSAGIFLSGAIATRLARRGLGPLQVYSGFFALFAAAQVVLILQLPSLSTLAWLVTAATGQTAILGFPWLQQQFAPALAGRVNSTLNFAMFAAAFAAQFLVGVIIDLFPGTGQGYDPRGYAWAFGLMLAAQFLALLWYAAAPWIQGREA